MKLNNIKNPFYHDKKIKIFKRNRIAKNYHDFNFLKNYSANDLIDKLKKLDIKFDLALEIGSHTGDFTKKLNHLNLIRKYISSDISFDMIKQVKNNYKVNFDEEKLPFKENLFDGIFSCIYLNEMNSLNDILIKIKSLLKKNGFFLFSIFGDETLKELKHAFYEIESKLLGGVSPRIYNFMDI